MNMSMEITKTSYVTLVSKDPWVLPVLIFVQYSKGIAMVHTGYLDEILCVETVPS